MGGATDRGRRTRLADNKPGSGGDDTGRAEEAGGRAAGVETEELLKELWTLLEDVERVIAQEGRRPAAAWRVP